MLLKSAMLHLQLLKHARLVLMTLLPLQAKMLLVLNLHLINATPQTKPPLIPRKLMLTKQVVNVTLSGEIMLMIIT